MSYFLFFIGFLLLIKGASLLVDGASSIAKKFNISELVIGLTIVSFGTSLPELIVNLFSSFGGEGSDQIAIGNILGSNISNVLLILGVSAIIYNIPVKKSTLFSEIPFSIMAVILVGFLANVALFDNDPNTLSRYDGIILLVFFALFMGYIVILVRSGEEVPIDDEVNNIASIKKAVFFIILGVVGLALGGHWVVEGAKTIANHFGISKGFVGLTIVAIGTSLPELITSAVAAMKKNTDIAVGNVIGSNIFNVLWILGLSATIKPLGFETKNNTDIAIVAGSTILVIVAMILGKRGVITRKTGVLYVLLYVAYMVYLYLREVA